MSNINTPRRKKKHNTSHTLSVSDIYKGNDEYNKFIKVTYPQICKGHEYIPTVLDAQKRIVVFGDIHGDFNLAVDMLSKAKLIDNDLKWIGGKTYVVQVGDQIDRCRPINGIACENKNITYNDEANDISIMELFNDLAKQATKVGGKVISLIGNHELLNSLGHLNYVSYEGINQFNNYIDPDSPDRIFENGHDARVRAFEPGKSIARMMGCTRMSAVIIGSNLFVHAGIIDSLIEEIKLKSVDDLEKINVAIRMWLLGLLDQKYVEHIIKISDKSMFWTRYLGQLPPDINMDDEKCSGNIKHALSLFKLGSMIIGHTPQSIENNDINSTCSGKVWRVDNGSSAAFNMYDGQFLKSGKVARNRRTQYLEIIDDNNYFICDGEQCTNKSRHY